MRMLQKAPVLVFLLAVVAVLPADEILTAPAYFDRIATRYGEFTDFQAAVTIKLGTETMEGELFHRRPNLLTIEFSAPSNEIISSDGKQLNVHIPRHGVTLRQPLRERTAEPTGLITEQGLSLMRRNYSIAYLTGPSEVALEPGSSEMVIKLRLEARGTTEGYRQLTISVNEEGLIRRIVGVTNDYRDVQMDFRNIRIDGSIPDEKFEFENPPTANVFENFIFELDRDGG